MGWLVTLTAPQRAAPHRTCTVCVWPQISGLCALSLAGLLLPEQDSSWQALGQGLTCLTELRLSFPIAADRLQ